jgi:hypothetical protein
MSREAMQLALAALESDPISHAGLVSRKQAITALRQALVDADDTSQERVDEKAKREQKPVAWLKTWSDGSLSVLKTKSPSFADHELEPLYTVPPKREWVWLTDEEIFSILENLQTIYNRPPTEDSRIIFAKTVEQALKEKNHG